MENIQKYFQENPQYFGIVLIVFGIIVFISTLFNASWLFDHSQNTYNLKKISGWINILAKSR
jgi:uncharacterized membrane protein